MMNLPVIRIEVERMRHSITTLLTEYQAQMDSYVRDAVDKFCEEDNLRAIIGASVNTELRRAIDDEIKTFYTDGEGRKVIREVVENVFSRGEG
jgi:t-SNARE complex subunit (syntaxin)